MERATGLDPTTWELKSSLLYFHNLQNRSRKMHEHAMHTVHTLPDLRIVAGRLGDGFVASDFQSNPEA
jgi:hypothetical protein